MAIEKNAVYQHWDGSQWVINNFKTTASQVKTTDGSNVESKINTMNTTVTNLNTKTNTLTSDMQTAKTDITNLKSNKANSSHNQAASTITGGTFKGQVAVPASTEYGSALLRNVVFTTTDPGVGASTGNPNGTIICVYE